MIINNYTHFIKAFDDARARYPDPDFIYRGRFFPPGDDAEVIVTTDSVTITINGSPPPAGHPMCELIYDHELVVRDVASADLAVYREIRIQGRWHNDGTEFQSFDPYITCKIDAHGEENCTRYDYDWCGLTRGRYSLDVTPEHTGQGVYGVLRAWTAQLTDYSHLSPGLAERVGMPTGLVWYPPDGYGLPILIIEHALELIQESKRDLETA